MGSLLVWSTSLKWPQFPHSLKHAGLRFIMPKNLSINGLCEHINKFKRFLLLTFGCLTIPKVWTSLTDKFSHSAIVKIASAFNQQLISLYLMIYSSSTISLGSSKCLYYGVQVSFGRVLGPGDKNALQLRLKFWLYKKC